MGKVQNIWSYIYIAVSEDQIMQVFLLMMFVLATFEVMSLFHGRRKDFKSSIMSMGVLGTFTGIFIGLSEFDSTNIVGSVPNLLGGLKVAFLTSIVGMFLAISLTIVEIILNKENEEEGMELEAILRKLDCLEHLEKIANNTTIGIQQVAGIRSDIREGQNSAISQLKESIDETRTTLLDCFVDTNEILRNALEAMSKGATKEVIHALNSVITDFNRHLTEQFGDNFKQLNLAVLKLVEWQEKYKNHVDTMQERLKIVEESTKLSAETIAIIADKNTETQKFFETIGKQIVNYEFNVKALEHQLRSLAAVDDKAMKSFETLDNGFAKILGGMDQVTDSIESSLAIQSQTLTDLTTDIKEQLPNSLGELEKTLASLTQKFGHDYEVFLNKCNRLLPK